MQSDPDYYEILQVHPDAEWEVIEAAYRRLARKYHPDVNKEAGAQQRMRELNAAFEVLGNPILREDYDRRRSYGSFVASEHVADSGFTTTVSTGRRRGLAATSRFWLRWLAVLPAAILSAVLISFPVHWAVMIFTGFAGDDDTIGLWDLPPETLERLGIAFFAPLAFIMAGAKVAPTHKLQTAIVLTILLAMAWSASVTYIASNRNIGFDYQGWGWLEFAAAIALSIGGVISAVYYVNQEESQR